MLYINNPQYFLKSTFAKTNIHDHLYIKLLKKKWCYNCHFYLKKKKNVPVSEQVEKAEEIFKGTTVDKLYKIVGEESLRQIWYMGVWWEQMKKILRWTLHPRK